MKQQQSRELEVEEERQRERPERKRGCFFGLEEEGERGESKDLSEGEMKTAPEKEEREETEGERRFPPLNGPSTEKREEGMRTHLRRGEGGIDFRIKLRRTAECGHFDYPTRQEEC